MNPRETCSVGGAAGAKTSVCPLVSACALSSAFNVPAGAVASCVAEAVVGHAAAAGAEAAVYSSTT